MSYLTAIPNKMLDAQITDAEWNRQRIQAKFMHDCGTKGFKRLKQLGRFHGGIDVKVKSAAPQHTALEFAEGAAAMVNEGMTISRACEKFGRNPGDLRYYCGKFGIELRKIRKAQS